MYFDARVLRIVLTLLACYLVWALREIIFLVILSVVVAYMLLPVVNFVYGFVTHHRHRGFALAAVYMVIFLVLFGVGGVIGYYAFRETAELASQIPDLAQPGAVDKVRLPKFLAPWDHQIRAQLEGWVQTHGKDMLQTITSISVRVLQGLGSVFSLLLVVLLSFLLLRNADSFMSGFLKLVPARYRPTAEAVLHDEHKLLAQWTRATVMVAIITVFIYGIGYALIGVPYSVLLAMIAFPFEFIPMIGAFIGFAIVLAVAFFTGFHGFLWVIVFFALVRLFVDYVLQPYMMGSGEIQLPTFVIILSALIGARLGGIPGVLLSIPAVATLRILYRHLVLHKGDAEVGYPTAIEA